MSLFTDSAERLKTSPEIMQAIENLANGDHDEAMKIWAFPTYRQLHTILDIVTNNGLMPSYKFKWGAEGTEWYSRLLADIYRTTAT